ncbi:MAG: hypothetical protein ACYCSF_09285 [Acidimicrobiales bacterium]
MQILRSFMHAAAGSMTAEVLGALVLGSALSGTVQILLGKEMGARLFGDASPTIAGAVGSACPYAAAGLTWQGPHLHAAGEREHGRDRVARGRQP